MIPRANNKPVSTNAALAVWEGIKDGPPGQRHLIVVLEKGPKGLTRATVLIATVGPGGPAAGGDFSGTESLTFESRDEARAFVSAWVWYRLARRSGPCAGGQPKGSGRRS